MPFIVEVDGHRHQIDQGDQRLQTLNMDMERKVQIRKEYRFNSPSVEVRVLTYEEPMLDYFAADREVTMPAPVLVDDNIRHIKNFLVQDGDKHYQEYEPRRNVDGEQIISRAQYERKFGHTKVAVRPEERERGKRALFESMYRPTPRPTSKDFGNKPSFSSPWDTPQKLKESHMPDWVTGARVQVADPMGQERYASGTVIEVKEGLPRGTTLICLDKPKPDGDDPLDICGSGYGHLVRTQDLRPLRDPRNHEAWYMDVPEHLAVVAPEGFTYMDITFPRGAVGRVITGPSSAGEGSGYTIAWLNVRDRHFRGGSDGKKEWSNVFSVPGDPLRWCRIEPGTYKVKRTFYSTFSPFEVGDYLVYVSEKPIPFPSKNGKEIQNHVVIPGVIFRHRGWDTERNCIQAVIVGGMSPETLGANLNLRKQDVRKFDQPFIPVGSAVEIVAEVIFKKKNLQGRRAKAVLPTDVDGDVGLEFPEDMGAGSLDGAGREGRCLYVPSQSVRLISE